ncbi:MAG: hypothetical protein Q8P49_02085, partial [Candidatus Liptonbacteria bacterium]|nr:hypothetical protein [Candidatus Liptonbacteria bacterium]
MTCIVTELVQWGTNLIVTFMAFIGGLFIAIEVWFIDVMLQINNNVTQQVLVQTGFSVTLALANLGFVLGIIVIALATILRNQTYGIKQILWKLVVAAILVNFSLVICGVIINFANTLTNYFMAPLGDATGFASSIGSVFQPQQFFTPQAGGAGGGVSTNSINSLFGAAGDSIGGILAPIITILTALIFIVAIVIVLATFFLMLLVRYIYLAFLLIFMPLAWVSWVFPMFKQHWSRWWSTFLRWTFFPPLVVFFLYLVIQTGNAITAKTANSPLAGANVSTTNFTTTANGVVGAISSFFGNVFTSILTTALNDVLLIGLAVGGLIAANSMSIKFADAGMKAFG